MYTGGNEYIDRTFDYTTRERERKIERERKEHGWPSSRVARSEPSVKYGEFLSTPNEKAVGVCTRTDRRLRHCCTPLHRPSTDRCTACHSNRICRFLCREIDFSRLTLDPRDSPLGLFPSTNLFLSRDASLLRGVALCSVPAKKGRKREREREEKEEFGFWTSVGRRGEVKVGLWRWREDRE